MMNLRSCLVVCAIFCLMAGLPVWVPPAAAASTAENAQKPIRVGSKNFNESYLLGEIVAQTLEAGGYQVERKFGLGGTLICYEALKNDGIDIYVEYTGTISQAILKLSGAASAEAMTAGLRAQGLQLLPQLGFNNTYAIAVRAASAERYNLENISDLAGVDELPMVFSHEFLEREDGWPGLQRAYNLSGSVRGIEHGLAYQALNDGAIGVTDAYSTDGELIRYNLVCPGGQSRLFPALLRGPAGDSQPGSRRAR